MTENSQNGRYILYGAVANRPEKPSSDTKVWLKKILDRIAFRLGQKSKINYKNYQRHYTYNRGDHSIIVATAQQLRKVYPNSEIITIDWEKLIVTNIRKKDKILICGSGYFFPNSEGIFPQRLHRDLEAIEASGAELHFLGVGYNYLLDWKPATGSSLPTESSELVQKLLAQATTLTVRDENTKRFLSGFTNREIDVIGDPALFIETTSHFQFINDKTRPPQIGINIPFHGHEPTEWIKKHLAQFAKILKSLKRSTGCDFTYFVHYDSEVLIAALIEDQGIPITVIDTDAVDLPHEYSKMDIHIGGMLHSCIIATAVGTPCIGLAYDEKHFGFFELMERSDYCLKANPFNANELLQKSINLLKKSTSERTKIKARRQDLMLKFKRTLKGIVT
jgi:polysaccharide pyruvyl transferase WcaK-like protein